MIQSVGDIVEEAMNKNKKEDEIKMSVIIHKLEETHMNNFDDRMKADMNKLSELLEEGVKIQTPEITTIRRIEKYNTDNKGKHRQINDVFNYNITRDNPDSTTTMDIRCIPLVEHRKGCTLFTMLIHSRTIVVYWCANSWC